MKAPERDPLLRRDTPPTDWPKGLEHGQCKLLFQKLDKTLHVFEFGWPGVFKCVDDLRIWVDPIEMPSAGMYEFRAILFFQDGADRHSYYGSADSEIRRFFLKIESNGDTRIADDNCAEVVDFYKWYDARTSLKFPGSDGVGKQAIFICRDALVTQHVRIGPAEIIPLSPSGLVDMAGSINEAVMAIGLPVSKFDFILERLGSHADRKSPMFLVNFPNILCDSSRILSDITPLLHRIFGILCLNRSAYPRSESIIFIHHHEEHMDINYFPHGSYYRGNLIGGGIARENAKHWDEQYSRIAADNFMTEVVRKLNSAFQETDLDISYFRFWSLLETIAYHLVGNNHVNDVEDVIRASLERGNIEQVYSLKLGKHSFTFKELLKMWNAWRDLTAHNGGMYAHYHGRRTRIQGDIRRLITAMKDENLILDFGEDRCHYLLRDAAVRAVEALVEKRIGSEGGEKGIKRKK